LPIAILCFLWYNGIIDKNNYAYYKSYEVIKMSETKIAAEFSKNFHKLDAEKLAEFTREMERIATHFDLPRRAGVLDINSEEFKQVMKDVETRAKERLKVHDTVDMTEEAAREVARAKVHEVVDMTEEAARAAERAKVHDVVDMTEEAARAKLHKTLDEFKKKNSQTIDASAFDELYREELQKIEIKPAVERSANNVTAREATRKEVHKFPETAMKATYAEKLYETVAAAGVKRKGLNGSISIEISDEAPHVAASPLSRAEINIIEAAVDAKRKNMKTQFEAAKTGAENLTTAPQAKETTISKLNQGLK
jgi:hypothetical protein